MIQTAIVRAYITFGHWRAAVHGQNIYLLKCKFEEFILNTFKIETLNVSVKKFSSCF